MNCSRTGCKEQATHYPKIMVPATDWPIDTHQPLGLFVGLALCHEHCKTFDAKEFLNTKSPDGKESNRILFEIMARGKVPPDFGRAFVHTVDMNSEEAIQFVKSSSKSGA